MASSAPYRIRTGDLRLDRAASTPDWTDRACVERTLGRIRTGTVRPLRPLPLPLGYEGVKTRGSGSSFERLVPRAGFEPADARFERAASTCWATGACSGS